MLLQRILTGIALWCCVGLAQAAERDFNLPDVNGVSHALSDYRGKWVVVNYWATWCPPCREEIPELVDFYQKHKDKDAVVLGVNFEDIGVKQLRAFVHEYLISYPVLRGEPAADSPLGDVPGLPTTFLINPEGKLVARQVGPVTGKMIEDYIARKRSTEAPPVHHTAVRVE